MKNMMIETKVFPSEVLKHDDENLIIEHFISTEKQDAGGDIMRADGMKLYGKPVVMLNHGLVGMNRLGIGIDSMAEPIAKPLGFRPGVSPAGNKGIIATTKYYDGSKLPTPDNTGRRLYEKARDGFMPNWSIDFKSIEFVPLADGGRDVKTWVCYGYSQVPTGLNDEATTPEVKAAMEKVKTEIKSLLSLSFGFDAEQETKTIEQLSDELADMKIKLADMEQEVSDNQSHKKTIFDSILDGDGVIPSEKPEAHEDDGILGDILINNSDSQTSILEE